MADRVPILLLDSANPEFTDNMIAAGVKSLPWVVGFDDRELVVSEPLAQDSVRKMTTIKRVDDADNAAEAQG